MNRGFVVAIGGAAIVIAGLSGCSSDKKSGTSGETSKAASAEGKSTVTIDGKDQAVQGTVVCSTMGGNVNIAIGDATTGIGAVVSSGDSPTVHSVGLGNVNGVTLGFQENAGQGEAKAERTATPTRSRAPRSVWTWPTPCSQSTSPSRSRSPARSSSLLVTKRRHPLRCRRFLCGQCVAGRRLA